MTRKGLLGLALLGLAACGGGENSVTILPPGSTNGPAVSGLVEAPDGRIALRRSWSQIAMTALVGPARALSSDAVSPVGRNELIELFRVEAGDIQDHQIQSNRGRVTFTSTDDAGLYTLYLPRETSAETCRFLVQYGNSSSGTLTRAFVYDSTVDINYQSEAVVRLILERIGGDLDLCDFSSGEIGDIYDAVARLVGDVGGGSVAAVNETATEIARASATVTAAIDEAALD